MLRAKKYSYKSSNMINRDNSGIYKGEGDKTNLQVLG